MLSLNHARDFVVDRTTDSVTITAAVTDRQIPRSLPVRVVSRHQEAAVRHTLRGRT